MTTTPVSDKPSPQQILFIFSLLENKLRDLLPQVPSDLGVQLGHGHIPSELSILLTELVGTYFLYGALGWSLGLPCKLGIGLDSLELDKFIHDLIQGSPADALHEANIYAGGNVHAPVQF